MIEIVQIDGTESEVVATVQDGDVVSGKDELDNVADTDDGYLEAFSNPPVVAQEVVDMDEKASGVPDNAVRAEDESDIPDDAQRIEGPRGGTYYIAGAGDADKDDLLDAMESVAEGNPAAEGQVGAIADHAESREQVIEAIQELHPDEQEEIFDEVGEESSTNYTDAEDVDEVVPEPPSEVIQQWEEQHSEELAIEARAHDMDVEEYKSAVADEYGRVMENAQPAVRTSPSLLDDILDDGRIKNQHETGTSGGWLDPEMRRDFESDYMGVPEDRPDEEMPIYGYASADGASTSEEPNNLESYGQASIRLDDDAQEDATVTFGDSLSANGGIGGRDEDSHTSFVATPANNPGVESLEPSKKSVGHDEDTQLEILENADDPTDLSMYNEMQFHGGVDADDIEEVYINATADFQDPPDDELIDRLEDAGIDVEVET